MDAVTDFILQNTVWIIIIAAIFAMALIGFIAEQNGYGEKKPKAKKVKEAKQKEETIEIEPLKEEMISLPQEPVKEETVVEKKEEPKKEILNIDSDFGKLLDDSEEDLLIGTTENSDVDKIDDEIWKF